MQWKEFFKPTKLTWIIFGIIVLILVLNGIILNIFDFGSWLLGVIPIYYPIIIFESIGLTLSTGSDWGLPLPNMFGYIIIVASNIIAIFVISLVLTKVVNKIKNSF